MPNVPNVPGVPRLASYSSGSPSLLLADALAVASAFSPPIWGVFLNGVPVIIPAIAGLQLVASTISSILSPLQSLASFLGAPNVLPVVASTLDFEFAQEWPLSDYPQEQGAFQSYNKVTLPFDVKVKVAAGGPPAARQAFINSILGISNSLSLFDIVTPEKVFTNCNVTHVDWRRNSKSGVSLITVDLWFKQIAVTSTATFTSTQEPAQAGQQSIGNVQPQVPDFQTTSAVTKATSNFAGF